MSKSNINPTQDKNRILENSTSLEKFAIENENLFSEVQSRIVRGSQSDWTTGNGIPRPLTSGMDL